MLTMANEFWKIWDRQLFRVTITKHRIKLTPGSTQPIRSARYRASLKDKEFELLEIEKKISQPVANPPQTEWAAPTVFVHKMGDSFRSCDDYQKKNRLKIET